MTSYVSPKKNSAFIFYRGLDSVSSAGKFQVNPTLAAGDFQVSIDGGALGNLATTPTVTPAGGKMVKFSLSADEMNGDNITVVCSDAAGNEWRDLIIPIQTSARQIDDLAFPATSGRSMVVDANGLVDANTVKVGPTGAGTAQTARDIGTSVLLSSGTGTGQILLSSGTVAARTYENGAIWVATTGATGTTANVHGQASRPVDRMSDVTSLLATMNLQNVEVGNGMSLTLETTHANQSFFGEEWTLALGGRDISGSYFEGATTTGTGTGTSPTFYRGHFGATTLPACDIIHSDISGTITCSGTGTYDFFECYGSAAIIDFGAAVGATTVNFSRFSGNLTIANLKTGDVLNFCGCGSLTMAASCTGGTVNKSGDLIFTNSGSGMTINTGSSGIDWANVANPTATVGLTNTTVGIVTALDAAYDAAKTAATQTSVNTIDGIVDNILLDTAEIGAAGAGLTALGDTRIANLDAAVSTRSTYAGGAVASVTAGVTVTTNNDKTGYALSQAFPTNFSAMGISAGGIVNVDVKYMNAAAMLGDGTAGNLWRGA